MSKHLLALFAIGLTGAAHAAMVTSSASVGFSSAQIISSSVAGCQYEPCWPQPNVPLEIPAKGVSASKSFSFRGQMATASGHVASPSLLTTSASVSTQSAPFDKLSATGSASFSDTLTFNSAGYEGQSVLLFVHYAITGSGKAEYVGTPPTFPGSSGSVYARGDVWLSLGGNSFSDYGSPGYGFFSPTYQYTGYKVLSAVIGQATNLRVQLSSQCDGLSFTGGFNCEANSQFKFLGIAGAASLDGTELANFGVTSKSGYDYINGVSPVPEPATYAMMGLGLLGLAAARARKSAGKPAQG